MIGAGGNRQGGQTTSGTHRLRRGLAAVAALTLVAGVGAVLVPTPASYASAGSYNLKWYGADPEANHAPFSPTYDKKLPSQLPCTAPSGGTGRASDPLSNAVAYGPGPTALDALTSLQPRDLVLGQVVPFEMEIGVSGSTAPENGTITFTAGFNTHSTSGDDFGFDPAYMLYCAFVDTADGGTVDPGNDAKVDSYASTLANPGGGATEEILGNVTVSGLDDGDTVVVELWVVLKSVLPAGGASGNVHTNLVSAATAGALSASINTGNQTVPLSKVGSFTNATISVVKTSSTTTITAAGQVVPYSFAVTNTGNVTLTGITVTDPSCNAAPSRTGGDTNGDNQLQTTETWTYTCSRTVTQAEIDTGGNLSNTVTADSVQSPPDTDTLDIPIVQSPALSIDKSAAETSYSVVGTVLHYSYLVTNTGNTTLHAAITVSDSKTTVTCPALPAAGLAPLGTVTCTATYTVTQADFNAGSVVNIASAHSGNVTSPTDTVTVPAVRPPTPVQNPSFDLTKTAEPVSGTVVQPGSTIIYTVTYRNTGNVELGDELVTDVLPAGAIFTSIADGGTYVVATTTASWHTGTVQPGDARVFHWTVTVASGQPAGTVIVNLARVGTTPSGETRHPIASGGLTLVKAVSAAQASVGSTLTYTLTVTATGTLDQTNLVVTDVVPTGTTYVAGSAGPAALASYAAATRTVTWTIGSLKAGETLGGLLFAVTIDQPPTAADGSWPPGTISNAGTAGSAQTPATPSNTVTTTVPGVIVSSPEPQPAVASPTPAPNGGGGGGAVLPFTGSFLPLRLASLAALTMIGLGLVLQARRRRHCR
ncbi:MAG: DUF11 domain-containing protein [Frankiaceae bacterium]|nr:DUF11 domain-containing protein [Frankiaceae bacterium]